MDFSKIKSQNFHRHILPYLRATAADTIDDTSDTVETWSMTYLRPSHMEGVANIAHKLWTPALASRLVRQVGSTFQSQPETAWFVISSGDKVAGFAGIRESWIMPKAAELIGINIDPEYQSIGFGRKLTEARIALAKECGSSYVIASTVQPGFFETLGFDIIDVHNEWFIVRKNI